MLLVADVLLLLLLLLLLVLGGALLLAASEAARIASIWAQILSAGPNLMDMAVIKWSGLSSMSACPSISCRAKSSA